MAFIGWFMGTRLGRILGALLAAAALLLGVFQHGRKAQRLDDRVDELQDWIKTKKEIDNVETSPDRGAALDRLRKNGW
jgi:hypothetical protein